MKLENLNKISRLSNEFSRLNGYIQQAIPNSEMQVSVCMEGKETPQFYFCIEQCPPETSRAIVDIVVAGLQKKRDALAEELRGLGVDI